MGPAMSVVNEYKISAHLLELILIAVHYSDSQNELLCIVVVENTVQIISEAFKGKKSVIWGKLQLNAGNKLLVNTTHLH